MTKAIQHDDYLDAPIWGVQKISELIDRERRATENLIRTGKLPATRVGGKYVTTRRKLLTAMGVL